MANTDPENVKAFYKIYGECVKELGLPLQDQLDARTSKCIGEKENFFDENGTIIKDRVHAYIHKLLIPGTEEQGHEIISECFKEGDENVIAFGECMVQHHIENFIEKPE
ncbi:hypothetical protein HN011_011454 [Eciton burchellii]|nr:hypothetical protein HN011_011454 [Eciton burchellii]